jgi:hypothetical protein
VLCDFLSTSSLQKRQLSATPGDNGKSLAGFRVDVVSVSKILFKLHADLSPALEKVFALIIGAIMHVVSPTRVGGGLPHGQLLSTVWTGFFRLFHSSHLLTAYGPIMKIRRCFSMSIRTLASRNTRISRLPVFEYMKQ